MLVSSLFRQELAYQKKQSSRFQLKTRPKVFDNLPFPLNINIPPNELIHALDQHFRFCAGGLQIAFR